MPWCDLCGESLDPASDVCPFCGEPVPLPKARVVDDEHEDVPEDDVDDEQGLEDLEDLEDGDLDDIDDIDDHDDPGEIPEEGVPEDEGFDDHDMVFEQMFGDRDASDGRRKAKETPHGPSKPSGRTAPAKGVEVKAPSQKGRKSLRTARLGLMVAVVSGIGLMLALALPWLIVSVEIDYVPVTVTYDYRMEVVHSDGPVEDWPSVEKGHEDERSGETLYYVLDEEGASHLSSRVWLGLAGLAGGIIFGVMTTAFGAGLDLSDPKRERLFHALFGGGCALISAPILYSGMSFAGLFITESMTKYGSDNAGSNVTYSPAGMAMIAIGLLILGIGMTAMRRASLDLASSGRGKRVKRPVGVVKEEQRVSDHIAESPPPPDDIPPPMPPGPDDERDCIGPDNEELEFSDAQDADDEIDDDEPTVEEFMKASREQDAHGKGDPATWMVGGFKRPRAGSEDEACAEGGGDDGR